MLLALFNIVRKETVQTLRDRRMLFVLLAAPLIQLVMFGYAIDLDVDHIPTVVCDEDRTVESRRLVDAFLADATFEMRRRVEHADEVHAALESGEAAAAVIVPRGFSVRFARHDDPEVQVIIDGSDSTRALVASNSASQFLALHGIGNSAMVASRGGPVIVPRFRYNPRLESPVYMLPGIAATLLLNVTAVVTAMGLARERESGTLEQVLVTPIRPSVLLAGKCIPFALLGLLVVVGVLVLGSTVFHVPIRGSLAVVGVGSFLYLFSSLGIGILLATMSTSQQQAVLTAMSFILPATLLSGFVSPIESMPGWLRPVTLLDPMRHYVEIMRGCLVKGAGFRDLVQQFAGLLVLGTGILAVSVLRFRKRVV